MERFRQFFAASSLLIRFPSIHAISFSPLLLLPSLTGRKGLGGELDRSFPLEAKLLDRPMKIHRPTLHRIAPQYSRPFPFVSPTPIRSFHNRMLLSCSSVARSPPFPRKLKRGFPSLSRATVPLTKTEHLFSHSPTPLLTRQRRARRGIYGFCSEQETNFPLNPSFFKIFCFGYKLPSISKFHHWRSHTSSV